MSDAIPKHRGSGKSISEFIAEQEASSPELADRLNAIRQSSTKEVIEEARRVVRVDHKGKKTRRIKCRPGFKRVGNRCIAMTGTEKAVRRRAVRKMVRTKRASPAVTKRASRKRLRALRRRKSMGIR